MQHPHNCGPNCCACDHTTPRQFEQTAARYNNESADNLSAARQNFILQQQAAWINLFQAMNDNRINSINQLKGPTNAG